jgi:tetratricopeptide (TPR) repeat protein
MSEREGRPSAAIAEAVECLARGLDIEERGDARGARRWYEKALKKAPDVYQTHYLLGRSCCREDRIEEAVEHFEAVLRLNPGHSESYNDLGCILLARDDLAGAKALFRKAVECMPENGIARRNLAWTCMSLQEYGDARREYGRILREDPEDVDALVQLATLYVRTGLQESGRRVYGRVLALDPGNGAARKALSIPESPGPSRTA